MWDNFDVVGQFDEEQSLAWNAEDTVNWYVLNNQEAKKPKALISVGGLRADVTTSDSGFNVRAFFSFNQFMYAVIGDHVYRYDTSLNQTTLGTLSTASGFVSIAANNGGQIMFVDGGFGYIYNTNTTAFGVITDSHFPSNPTMVTYLDGRFIVTFANTNLFYISAPNDGTVWDSLGFATANAYPGNLIGLSVVNRRLFLFKQDSTEVWYDAGSSDFPFRRDNDLIFNYGCASANSIYSENGYLFWLSSDKDGVSSVMSSNGDVPTPVSTQAIDNKIRSFTDFSDVSSYIYKEDGHIFYVLNWTTDDKTYVYDANTNFWHRMQTIPHIPIEGQPNVSKTRHWGNCHAYFNNTHYLGSFKDPIIYSFSSDYSNNDGEPIPRIRVLRHLSQPNYRAMQVDGIQIDFQAGIGNVNPPYEFPQAYLSISKDGGQTYGNEMRAAIGRVGIRNTRTIWRLLGKYYDMLAKITIYDDVSPIIMLGGAIDMKVLDI